MAKDITDLTKLTDELLYVAQCDSEEERQQLVLELEETYGAPALAEKGSYVIWLLETLTKVRNVAAAEHLTDSQRSVWGIDPEWIAQTLILAHQSEAGVQHLRRLLHRPE